MAGVNKVILIGNLGKEPEVRTLKNGTKVANFSIATSETWFDRGSGEKKEKTEWHNIVVWKNTAEVVEKYVKKGDKVYIEGKLQTRSWEKDGVTRYTTEIVCHSLVMLGGSGGGGAQQNSNSSYGPPAARPPITPETGAEIKEDDLPF